MNYCPKCGAELRPSDRVCNYCNEELHTPQRHNKAHRRDYCGPENEPGAKIIKVTSIILTILGARAIYMSLVALAGQIYDVPVSFIAYKFFMAAIMLNIGVISFLKYKNSKSTILFIIMGALLIALKSTEFIWALNIMEMEDLKIVIPIIDCILPILLIIGSIKMKLDRKQLELS